ncbi:MAG: tetratricopeptide repeat protein [candidate division KSB1 bacterium]|nr:tetratricopeptide repeat protein [candidate division KSB1 bacterium]MDZ7305060.1 tetratricopeptide repeat protein [candidate division KSB1 bacterium]MDZ7313827.1 tetratricopeptide repeat protein [candidate division KSB1 bacterium]
MAREFQPTDSKNFFVGRMRELEQITRILENGPPKWLIQVQGDGGIGKTRFLESLRDRLRGNGKKKTWLYTDLIDFYKASNQTEFGLLAEIARQLGREYFPKFEAQRESFWKVLTTNPDASLYQDAVHRVAHAFFEDWRQLLKSGRHVVLFFDTCEEMHDLVSWVMRTLLPSLLKVQEEIQAETGLSTSRTFAFHPQTFTVWATRTPLPFLKELEPYLLNLELSPLSLADVKEFFRQAGWYPGKIKLPQLEQLNERCGGRPLYVALSYDWLKNGKGVIADLLGNHTPFGEKLVNWISRLKNIQTDVILAAALAWRRMEPGLLARLLNISETEAGKLLENLGRFSFVKYRPPAKDFEGSFQLHDEMRDLVKRHLWPRESPWETKAMLQQVIAWYRSRINNPEVLAGRDLPKTDEMRALLAEYIYYECELDPNEGSRIGERLFKHNVHYLDLAFCELLNFEIGRFEQYLSNERIDQLRFQQALVAFRKEDYDWASELWHSLIRRPDCNKKLKATSHMMLVELEGYTGQYDEALDHAGIAEKFYRELLQQPGLEAETRVLVEKELGQVYNNWGYIYRIQGRLDLALTYYQKALDHYHYQITAEQAKTQKNIARSLNNIGYVYFLQGDTEKAVTYIDKALQLRQELGIAYECGLGSNTLGMVMENMGRIDSAASLYHKAYYYFEAARSDRGLALVQINLGRLLRMANDFTKALKHLHAAARVLKNKGDTAYLIIALNEIGCAYRQQGNPEARGLAEKYLLESLELSEKIKNYQAIADNLDDLQILFYQWGLSLKKQGKKELGDSYLKQAISYGREAQKIAQNHGLMTILANVERTTGDIDFEQQDYEKAFQHFLNACHLIAQAAHAKGRIAIQFQQRLAENANQLQQRLHALPRQEETKYAKKILNWMDDLPHEIASQLSVLRTFLDETLQLSQYPVAVP